MSEDDDLFSRWSNRKRAVAQEGAAKTTSVSAGEETTGTPDRDDVAGAPEESEDAILARFGLPSPESLGPGDDFSGFMQSGVPEFLRRRALRRLWRSNPVLANLDGLNDYDEDFTSPEETMKVLKTAYKVGRGFLRDPEEQVADNEQGGEDADSEAGAIASDPPAGAAIAEGEPQDTRVAEASGPETKAASPTKPKAEHRAESPADSGEKRPRRMQFRT